MGLWDFARNSRCSYPPTYGTTFAAHGEYRRTSASRRHSSRFSRFLVPPLLCPCHFRSGADGRNLPGQGTFCAGGKTLLAGRRGARRSLCATRLAGTEGERCRLVGIVAGRHGAVVVGHISSFVVVDAGLV